MSTCGEHHYGNIDRAKIDITLTELRNSGAAVTGDNPWDVDTRKHGIKLRGAWESGTSTLTISVTAKSWYVPCGKVWGTIDELVHHIQQLPPEDVVTVKTMHAKL